MTARTEGPTCTGGITGIEYPTSRNGYSPLQWEIAEGSEPVISRTHKEFPPWSVSAFLLAVVVLALSLTGLLLGRVIAFENNATGLLIFCVVALLTELLSIEVYVKDTTVSTSVAPLLGGSLLFGAVGAGILGLSIAIASWIKHRTPARHLVFNSSNHMIGGLLCAGFISLTGRPLIAWPLPMQLAITAAATGVIYFTTTGLLATVIGLSKERAPGSVWIERFQWLAPYYLTLGIVAHALIYSYHAAGLSGVVVITVPLLILRLSEKQYVERTREIVGQLRHTNRELAKQASEITRLNEELLLALARSIDVRDPYGLEHSKNVSRYATLMAKELGLPWEQIEQIRKASLLHDIGKLGIAEAILFKPDRLADDEYITIKEHVLVGAELIRGCHSLQRLIPFVKHHHERYDGKGYPDGLAGDEIPLEARIVSLADAVEAMASDRPYKKSLSPQAILEEIRRCAGAQFDPVIVEAFCQVVEKHGETLIVNSAKELTNRRDAVGNNYVEVLNLHGTGI